MDIDAVYEAIAAGTARDPDLSWTRRRLQAMALGRAKEGTDDQRLGALRVAAVLGPRDGIPVVAELVRDPHPQVRAWAVSQAIGARELGISPLRTSLEGPDPEQVRLALDHLTAWVDQGCVPALRRLLSSSDAGVRQRAVVLLGNVGGPSIRGELERLVRDPEPEVQQAATVALEVLAGTRPRAVRTPWWDEEPEAQPEASPDAVAPSEVPAETLAAPPVEAPAPRVEAPTPPVEVAPEPAPAIIPASAAPPAWGADARRWGGPPPSERSRPAVSATAPPTSTWDGHVVPLPTTLPDETRALVKLLGMVAAEDRAPVLALFRQGDAKRRREEFSVLLMGYAGADPALGRGLCVLAAEIGGPAHVTGLRPLLRDPSVWVRSASLLALGALAPPSAIPWMAPFLDDPVVREAAVDALAGLGRRVRADLVRDALKRVRTDDPAFKARVDAAIGSLPA
jgi:HEAT repeat protein